MIYLFVLLAAYALNITYMSIFYHRGLAHGSVVLGPRLRRFVAVTGSWVTGLDPKAWACMHRLHHVHSDGEQDPHSPHHGGLLGVFRAQLFSYMQVLRGLTVGRKKYTDIVPDLDFPVSWANRGRFWMVPYVLHVAIAAAIGVVSGDTLLAACYWIGLMSHPVQGWMVNALGHAYGYRNYDTPDQSRNNTLVAWSVMGEGFQNNHHRYPGSAQFSARWWELDLGFVICMGLDTIGVLQVRRASLISELERSVPDPLGFSADRTSQS